MAVITGTPFKMADATLKIAADNYEAMISSAEIVPTSSVSTFAAISGRKVPIVGKSSYMLNLTFAQDWSATTGLSRKLFDGEGTTAVVILTPRTGGPAVTVSVVLVAPNIGGAAEADAVSSVSLPCIDKPVIA